MMQCKLTPGYTSEHPDNKTEVSQSLWVHAFVYSGESISQLWSLTCVVSLYQGLGCCCDVSGTQLKPLPRFPVFCQKIFHNYVMMLIFGPFWLSTTLPVMHFCPMSVKDTVSGICVSPANPCASKTPISSILR